MTVYYLNNVGRAADDRELCIKALKPSASTQAAAACKHYGDTTSVAQVNVNDITECTKILTPEYIRLKLYGKCDNILPGIWISHHATTAYTSIVCGKAIC